MNIDGVPKLSPYEKKALLQDVIALLADVSMVGHRPRELSAKLRRWLKEFST
jgi:hypothetical protein